MQEQIASDATMAAPLMDQVVAELERRSWSSRDIFQIRMALEEAMTNAIEHGNGRDKNKNVEFGVRVDDEIFQADIVDQGQGFDRSEVPDCTSMDRWDMQRGRGVMLMESFMSSVEYLGTGNHVRMTRRRDDPELQPDTR